MFETLVKIKGRKFYVISFKFLIMKLKPILSSYYEIFIPFTFNLILIFIALTSQDEITLTKDK